MSVESNVSRGIRPSRDQVLQEVKQIVGDLEGIGPEKIRETSELEADLGCDSLSLVEIMMEVEEHFGISVPDEVGEQARTIVDIVDGVLQLLDQHHEKRT